MLARDGFVDHQPQLGTQVHESEVFGGHGDH